MLKSIWDRLKSVGAKDSETFTGEECKQIVDHINRVTKHGNQASNDLSRLEYPDNTGR